MAQKSITVRGKRYTGKQIAKHFNGGNMTRGGDYIINLNGDKFFANYRQIQDSYWAPVCAAEKANAVALMPEHSYSWDVWVTL